MSISISPQRKAIKGVRAFDQIDKRTIKGKVGHTRTGACTSRGKCYHGMRKAH